MGSWDFHLQLVGAQVLPYQFSTDAPSNLILPGRQANLRRGDRGTSRVETCRLGKDDVEPFVWKGEMRIHYLKLWNDFSIPKMNIIYFQSMDESVPNFRKFLVRSSNVAKYMWKDSVQIVTWGQPLRILVDQLEMLCFTIHPFFGSKDLRYSCGESYRYL